MERMEKELKGKEALKMKDPSCPIRSLKLRMSLKKKMYMKMTKNPKDQKRITKKIQ